MYERIDLPADSPIVGLRIQKDINDSENLELVDLIQQRARRHGPVRLLVVYEADPGLMGAESLYDNMRFAKQVSENLAKMAVIGKHAWENTWMGVFGLSTPAASTKLRSSGYAWHLVLRLVRRSSLERRRIIRKDIVLLFWFPFAFRVINRYYPGRLNTIRI